MSQLIEYELESGESIIFEVQENDSDETERASIDTRISKAEQVFEQSIQRLLPVAKSVLETVKKLEAEEIGIEFGVKLAADSNLIITKAAAESNFKITMKWTKK